MAGEAAARAPLRPRRRLPPPPPRKQRRALVSGNRGLPASLSRRLRCPPSSAGTRTAGDAAAAAHAGGRAAHTHRALPGNPLALTR